MKTTHPSAGWAPAIVEVTRGPLVESAHEGLVAVVDVEGRIVLGTGDVETAVYPRSGIKPLQAIPLLETGAADAFAVTDTEIALACASHDGEPRHVAAVAAWLERIGCREEDLECGAHAPYDTASAADLHCAGAVPTPLHNNCSGKHAGFLTLARHLGHPTVDYRLHEHPVQQRVLGVLETMCGLDLSTAPRGIDGCGIPTLGIPLGNIALAMARLGRPGDQPEHRQAACTRILTAMKAAPEMVEGRGRYCSVVIGASGVIVKTGAEGVCCGLLPAEGLGFAVKVRDGGKRAAEALATAVLKRLEGLFPGTLSPEALLAIDAATPGCLINRRGEDVGSIRIDWRERSAERETAP